MKKIISLLLIVTMLFSFSGIMGCSLIMKDGTTPSVQNIDPEKVKALVSQAVTLIADAQGVYTILSALLKSSTTETSTVQTLLIDLASALQILSVAVTNENVNETMLLNFQSVLDKAKSFVKTHVPPKEQLMLLKK